MTDPTYAEQLAADQAKREAARAARRASLPYNRDAPTDHAGTVADAKGTRRRRRATPPETGDAA